MRKKLLGLLLVILPLAGCSCDHDFEAEQMALNMNAEKAAQERQVQAPTDSATEPEKKVDAGVTSCGDFPRSANDGTVQSRYAICKNAETGGCYIKTYYPKPTPGCDPKFGTFRTGDPACFTYMNDVHELNGNVLLRSQVDYRAGDKCEYTTAELFASVMTAWNKK